MQTNFPLSITGGVMAELVYAGVFRLLMKSAADAAAEDHSYPSTIPAHIIYLQMASNFPPDAIEWVKRAKWQGPMDIPWEQVDIDDIKNWAASKQPERVKEFEQQIKAHGGDVKPSILIQDDDSPKSIVIDGHHRALARHNLGMPVLSYIGRIDPKDRMAAEETHSKQVHSGSDPKNT